MVTLQGDPSSVGGIPPFFALQNVSYGYRQGSKELSVLRNVNFLMSQQEMVALIGPSGSGKSTLLHLAGLLDHPQQGGILLQGKRVSHLKDAERTRLRGHYIGFVYQSHRLLPDFSALENICLPQLIQGISVSNARHKALHLLKAVHLEKRASHKPGELSGGEQQRVAIARALANDPQLLLADEPTGNLDEATGKIVFDLLHHLSQERSLTVLMATHNPDLAKKMDRTVHLHEGNLTESRRERVDV
jgi:lipoprotein-releasing system ATP-binding protein